MFCAFYLQNFLPFAELFCYLSHQVKKNMHTLSLFAYNVQEITNNLKIHRLDKINKPVKFLMG